MVQIPKSHVQNGIWDTQGAIWPMFLYHLRSKYCKNWAVKNFKENAIVNKYTINLEKLNDGGLKIKRFYANAEWAEFVWRNRYDIHFKRPNYDIIIGPIADKDLKQQFIKRKTEGLSFAQVANLIHYDKFHSLQVCFCSDYALSMLELID